MAEQDRIIGTIMTNLSNRGYAAESQERPTLDQNKKALEAWMEERRERIEANRYKIRVMP